MREEIKGKLERIERVKKIRRVSISFNEEKEVKEWTNRYPNVLKSGTREHIELLETRGILRKSTSTLRNSIKIIEKDDDKIRLVLNLMALNHLVEKDSYQLTNIRDVVRAADRSF